MQIVRLYQAVSRVKDRTSMTGKPCWKLSVYASMAIFEFSDDDMNNLWVRRPKKLIAQHSDSFVGCHR